MITGMVSSISVNVGDFLELQRAFERQRLTGASALVVENQ
jgi:hypothetical protein